MENGVDLMRFDSDSYACSEPLYFFFVVLVLVLQLELFVEFFDFVDLLLVEGFVLLDFFFELVSGEKGRSLKISVEAFDAELESVWNNHIRAFLL